jgi:hypothetical protein
MMRESRPQRSEEEFIGKVVGHRKMRATTLEDADRLLRTAWALRGTDRLVPGGVYRFVTFEEANQWMTRMMARTHAHQTSKISLESAAPLMKHAPATS